MEHLDVLVVFAPCTIGAAHCAEKVTTTTAEVAGDISTLVKYLLEPFSCFPLTVTLPI